MAVPASWEVYGSTAVLAHSLSRQLIDLRNSGFSLPWTCEVCEFSNHRTFGTCEACVTKNDRYDDTIATLTKNAGPATDDHVLLLLARAKGPKCIEACFALCEAIASESATPGKAIWYYRRAFKFWPELDSDLCEDGVPSSLREEADSILVAMSDLAMHKLPSNVDPILGTEYSVAAPDCRSQTSKEESGVPIQRPPQEPAGSISEPFAIIIPMRGRERQLQQFVPQVRSYLLKQGMSQFQILVVEQEIGRPFNRGLSLNVGVAHLLRVHPQIKHICFHDVDIVPTEGVDYSCGDKPTYLIGTRLLREPANHEEIPDDVVKSFELLSDKTLGAPSCLGHIPRSHARDRVKSGALVCPVGTFLAANGWSNNYWGWGEEDVDFEQRLSCVSKVLHRNGVFTSLDLGFHLFTSFGHRWCRFMGKGSRDASEAWLDVAQVLNKEHSRNTIFLLEQQKRRQETTDVDSIDGFRSLDLDSLHITDVVTDGTYMHVKFDVGTQFGDQNITSSVIAWPTPCPLEGIKSRNRAILGVSLGIDTDTKFTLTLSSRIAIVGDAWNLFSAFLSPETDMPAVKRHSDLRILHLGPSHLPTSAAQAGYSKAMDSAVCDRHPHVIVLHESFDAGDAAWKDAYHELLAGSRLHEFGGAVIICCTVDLDLARQLCKEQWGATKGELKVYQDALNKKLS